MMDIGIKAPDYLGLDEEGKEVRLSEYRGKKLALYFYPKDNTSGCTAQACSLRDSYEDLLELGMDVIGVSIDSDESHRKFKEKHNLPFRLIADVDKKLVEEFGVWQEKKMFGNTYMGTVRTTFVIDEEGVIEEVFRNRKVKTKEHGLQLINLFEKN